MATLLIFSGLQAKADSLYISGTIAENIKTKIVFDKKKNQHTFSFGSNSDLSYQVVIDKYIAGNKQENMVNSITVDGKPLLLELQKLKISDYKVTIRSIE